MIKYKIEHDSIPIAEFKDGKISTFPRYQDPGVSVFFWDEEDTKKLFEAMKEYYEPPEAPMKEAYTKETTPNCGMCEWSFRVWNKNNEIIAHECTAQGHKLCRDCYNTAECKKLFQEENDE